MKARQSLTLLALAALAATPLASTAQAAAPAAATATALPRTVEPAGTTVVGTIDKQPITFAQLLARSEPSLNALHELQEQARLHTLEQGEHERHNVLEAELGKWLDERALAAEAAAQKSTPEALLAALKPEPVQESEQRDFYQQRKGAADPPWESARAQIGERVHQYLMTQHAEQARRRYLDGLRTLHGISGQLPPYRVAIPAGGPLRGKAGAPVTLVEFGDFQCPYCQRAQPAVQALLARHADDLQLEFRHFPLEQLHPNARSAAFAAECARQQGHFWEMHDALYADQEALNPSQLQATAGRLGLEPQAFARCLADPATARVIDADLRIGAAAGVAGTPSFYVNGLPVSGDPESLEHAVAAELAHPAAR